MSSIAKKRTLVAWVATAAAVTALGAGSLGAQAASPVTKEKVAVGQVKVDQAFLAKERAAGKAAVADTAASKAALSTVQARVKSYVAKNGTKYTFGTYADPATGKIVIDTNAPSSVVASLTNLKSSKVASSVKVQVRKSTIKDSFNRRDDVPAFYAGGGISGPGGTCSTGYAVTNASGYKWMVTAGHCFAIGNTVNTESNLRRVGVVTNRGLASLGNGPIDMELLGGEAYAGRVFTGGIFSNTSIPVVSAGSAVAGYTAYCHSGRTTGEQCGHKATSTTGQVCTQTGCKSPVIVYTGGTINQPGDSGGTFYAKNSTGAYIRGHVIASNSTGTVGYAETWNKVTARYGVSIVKG